MGDNNIKLMDLLNNPAIIDPAIIENIKSILYDEDGAGYPNPALSCLFITNCPNNMHILVHQIFNILIAPEMTFRCQNILDALIYMPVDRDIYIEGQNHGIYTLCTGMLAQYNSINLDFTQYPLIYFIDLLRVRYSDYGYMIKVLEMLLKTRRIDNDYKQIIIISNFDQLLDIYLPKFIEYIDKYSSTGAFILLGSGKKIVNMSRNTKLKSLCYIDRIFLGPVKLEYYNSAPTQLEYTQFQQLSKILYKLTDGDLIKSWMVIGNYLNMDDKKRQQLLKYKTPLAILEKIILPGLPVYKKIYDLIVLLMTCNIVRDLDNIMKHIYMIHTFPGYTPTKIINIMICLLTYLIPEPVPAAGQKKLTQIIKLGADVAASDLTTVDEPIILIQEFIIKLAGIINKSSSSV